MKVLGLIFQVLCLIISFSFLVLQQSDAEEEVLIKLQVPRLNKCRIDKIYQFGDSLYDTGNCIKESVCATRYECKNPPYGINLSKKIATGPRCSDGLLIIDFMALECGLNPYKDQNANFMHGVNFAVAGATTLPAEILTEKKNIVDLVTNSSLYVQLDWMSSQLKTSCSTGPEKFRMAQNLALNAFAQPVAENLASAIQLPDFETESFYITQTMVSLLSNAGLFTGRSTDDPQKHLKKFMRVCETQKHARVPAEVMRLMLFPFSLTDVASDWFDSLPVNSITSWDELVIEFLKKFFPPNKTAKMVDEILMFRQNPLETLPEAWERFKSCLQKCPHHGIPDQMLGQRLYMGMNDHIKGNLDAAAGGAFLSKTFAEAKVLLDVMA